mgnify:CR=1 FL=1
MSKDDVFFEEKDSGWFKWIVFLALVLLLCAAGSYVYYKFTPKVILVDTFSEIKYTANKIRDNYSFGYNFSYNIYTENKEVQDFLEYFNKFNISFKSNSNLKDNLEETIYLNYEDKETYKVSAYFYKDEFYLKFFDKVYLLDEESFNGNLEENEVNYKEYKKYIKELIPYLNSESKESSMLEKVIEVFGNTLNKDDLKRKVTKDNLVITVNLDDEFYKRLESNLESIKFKEYLSEYDLTYEDVFSIENFKPEKIVFTYKFDNYKIVLSQIDIIQDKEDLVIGILKDTISFDYKVNEKLEFKVVFEVKDNEYKVIIQCDKVGLLVSLNFKEEETDYEEVKVDLSNVKKISEFNEDDYTYLIEQIENSDGMKELVNQLLEKYTKVQEEMIWKNI